MARAGTSRHTSIREKFSRSNRSASNALTSRSSKKTAGNKTKRKMEHWSTIPRMMMMTFYLWNERLIFTSEEVSASEEVFASTAESCSVDFFFISVVKELWDCRDLLCFIHLLKLSFVSLILTYLYLYVCKFNERRPLPLLGQNLKTS